MSDLNALPPAAKLACLIEAGRAANPDLHLDGRVYLVPKMFCGCALAFAALARGAKRQWNSDFLEHLNDLRHEFGWELTGDVELAAMRKGASLDDIILSLREGELAKVPA